MDVTIAFLIKNFAVVLNTVLSTIILFFMGIIYKKWKKREKVDNYYRKKVDVLILSLFKHNGLRETFEKEMKDYMREDDYLNK